MAHADYDCCAVCDCKMAYNDVEPRTKESICGECVASMARQGHILGNVAELIAWMDRERPEVVVPVLGAAGFTRCFYGNRVDEAFMKLKDRM